MSGAQVMAGMQQAGMRTARRANGRTDRSQHQLTCCSPPW